MMLQKMVSRTLNCLEVAGCTGRGRSVPQGSLPKGQYTSHTDIPQARLKRYNSKSSLDGVCQQKALRSVDLLILLLNVLGDFLENLMRLEKNPPVLL